MSPASTGASTDMGAVSSLSAPAPAPDSRMAPGGPGYRRMSFALFLAGVATFALLYSTQALLPLISGDLGVTASEASWTVAAATAGLALFVLPLSALSERYGRRTVMTASRAGPGPVGLPGPPPPPRGVLGGVGGREMVIRDRPGRGKGAGRAGARKPASGVA